MAIVGRPNVGKSTLFNRLLGFRKAVVSPLRGTTRDRVDGALEWRGVPFTVIDTGGFEFSEAKGLEGSIQRHVRQAVAQANSVVVVLDGQAGLVPADQMVLEHVRRSGRPVLVAVNKIDHGAVVPPDFFALGANTVLPVSALHGLGIGELLDRLTAEASVPPSAGLATSPAPSLAIIGRQNVGKSSLLNAILREERVIVSEQPGTTRDAIDTWVNVDGRSCILIDTAGLRHRRKVKTPVDLFAMSRTIDAIRRSNVALLLLDATQGITSDDRRIAAQVCREGSGVVLMVNKWDLVTRGKLETLADSVHRALPMVSFAPVVAVSAKTGFQVRRCVVEALKVARAMEQGIDREVLDTLLRRAWREHPAPRIRGRAISLDEVRWVGGRPAAIELVTRPFGALPPPYTRYLVKALHAHPQLSGIPLSLVVRGRERRHRP